MPGPPPVPWTWQIFIRPVATIQAASGPDRPGIRAQACAQSLGASPFPQGPLVGPARRRLLRRRAVLRPQVPGPPGAELTGRLGCGASVASCFNN
jgi:hypothetical protein